MLDERVSASLFLRSLLACAGLLLACGSKTQLDGGEELDGGGGPPSSSGGRDAGRGPLISTTALAVGAFHTCALLSNGRVRCWGRGTSGRLGYGNVAHVGDDEPPAAAGDVQIGARAVQIAAGESHTCALLEQGRVRCWGLGLLGALGYGNQEAIGDAEAPASAGDVPVAEPVLALAAGDNHTCALLDAGRVRCWGHGTNGQLGFGRATNIGNDEPASAGQDVDLGASAIALAAGYTRACALLEGGRLRCWGHGVLGYPGASSGASVTPRESGDIRIGAPVVKVALGRHHTCALLESGAIRCWGDGNFGVLGYGDTRDVGDDEAPESAGDVPLGARALDVVAGAHHTCALLEGGRVKCWGTARVLGHPSRSAVGDDEVPASSPDVMLGGSATALAPGDGEHACALLDDGAVRCWGEGRYGRLGYASDEAVDAPALAGDVKIF